MILLNYSSCLLTLCSLLVLQNVSRTLAFVTSRSFRTSSAAFPLLRATSGEISVRDCTFAELTQVSDLIMSSFYANATSPWSQLYRMGELNRIQQGFPYADKAQHRVLVAATTNATSQIVGYIDVDDRVPNRNTSYKYNPRPYLSDLCIAPEYRRRGIARALVEECEDFCLSKLEKNEAFIRVEKKNVAALTMYQSMGYSPIDNHPDSSNEEILLLRKDLSATANVDTAADTKEEQQVCESETISN